NGFVQEAPMERRCHHAQYYECNCGPCAGRENQRCYEELQQSNCDNERKKRRVLRGEFLLRGQGSGPFALSAATNHGSWPPASYDPADRKSTRLNSSHRTISYAVFCLKKK